MQTTFWTALLTSIAAAAVTSLGIWTIRRFTAYDRDKGKNCTYHL